MEEKICMSCGKKTTEYVSFPCVNCGHEIIRCKTCRARSSEYVCPVCGTKGP